MADEDVVELKLEEENELLFKIVVQGASNKPNAIRLVCEQSDMSLVFKGEPSSDGSVSFRIPPMEKFLLPETVYDCAVEVLVDGKFFRPVQFPVKFKADVKCVVESVQVRTRQPEPSVSVVVAKPRVEKPAAPPPTSLRIEKPAPKKNLQERKPTMGLTGLDDKTMEEVARSTIAKLIAMDSGGKTGK